MTASQLLAWILTAFALQGLAAAAWAWMRCGKPQAASTGAAPGPDLVASAAAWQGLRKFRVLRRDHEDPSRSQCSFYLAPLDAAPLPAFRAGQYLTFSFDAHATAGVQAGGRVTRCYSLSDRPGAGHYRVTIKRVGAPAQHPEWPPGVSSTHFHDQVQAGDVVEARAPAGHFFLDTTSEAPVVLIAGGIGITPMMSMLLWCIAEQPQRAVHLYYGVRHGAEHAFKDTLASLATTHPPFRLQVAYSQPAAGDRAGIDYQHAGRVDLALLQQTLPHGRHQFYVCGPAAMMESLVPALVAWGVPEADIHFEAFGPASVQLPSTAQAATVTSGPLEVRFSRSGRSLTWQGDEGNLLDFAERHGMAIESGCRSGSCGSCETRVLAGSVRYRQTPDHAPQPGHCLLCVATPVANLELEA